ncbi:hypothetical protein FRUB_08053 [Fimbriiglobus ruber]|uniref:Uncharacterized protein n=1 Tax=Fimbriiglobus ruber TaxID=1908690 RepID=A0A225D1K7_9BACT|nr:hypothetical protein FRUB_08053 [Fimbriiglobus ruber]
MVDEQFVIEHIWRLFDQFQAPRTGNRSPSAEATAKRKAKEVFDRLHPYFRTTEPMSVSLEKCAMALMDAKPGNGAAYPLAEKYAKAVLDAAGVNYVD